MVNAIALGSVVLAMLVPAAAPDAPDVEEIVAPDGVTVEVVTVNGSGCPAGTGTAVLSADRSTVEITSPAYYAWAGGEAYPVEFRRNCQISLQVNRPAGTTYAVARVRSAGFAYLAKGAVGTSRVSLYFQGLSDTVAVTRNFAGPMADTWTTNDVPGPEYAPCGTERLLNINTELRVNAGGADPSITNFMVREPTTTLRLVWKRCA